jgi:hypothetical protein
MNREEKKKEGKREKIGKEDRGEEKRSKTHSEWFGT